MSEVLKDKILQILPEASIMGVNSVTYISDIVEKIEAGFKVTRTNDAPHLLSGYNRARINHAKGIVQIAEGCLENCTFCVDRTTRGSLVSYEPTKVIDDVQAALRDGCVEIHLNAQDTASYGIDTKMRLPALLRKLSVLSGKYKILLSAMNPANVLSILEDLILSYNHPKIYQHLNLPLQSGSNTILKEMKRNYTIEEYQMIISAFRERYPSITLSTDIIVGFPGETDDEFAKTVRALKEIKPEVINIYAYGQRPYAKAPATKIPSWKIRERIIELEQLSDNISEKKDSSWIGWRGEVLVTDPTDNGFIARNYAYKPIFVDKKKTKLGEIKTIEITRTYANHLIGN